MRGPFADAYFWVALLNDQDLGHPAARVAGGRSMASSFRKAAHGLVLLMVWASPALPCTCMPRPSVGRALSESSAVFVGRVVGRRGAEIEFAPGRSSDGYAFVFEVEQRYKGLLSSRVAVRTGMGRGDCGWPFRVGERYLVYAYGEETLETNICTRTTTLDRAGADLAELGEPATIFVPVARFPMVTAAAVALVAFLAGFVIGRARLPRRRRGVPEVDREFP
jgi:hypothetical protein